MANVIIVLILVAAVGYGMYSFIHHLRHGGGCCGEHDAPAKKVRAADTNKSHYPHRLVMGVDGMTCQNCQRHVENALNTLPEMQGRRVEACVIDDKSYAEVGRTEGVHSGSVRGSVLRGLESMKEYLKENW